MTYAPTFTLSAGHEPRPVRLVLTRVYPGRGWLFMGRSDQGYATRALSPHTGEVLPEFPSRADAAEYASDESLPPYAVWNGRKRAYDGLESAYVATATPRA